MPDKCSVGSRRNKKTQKCVQNKCPTRSIGKCRSATKVYADLYSGKRCPTNSKRTCIYTKDPVHRPVSFTTIKKEEYRPGPFTTIKKEEYRPGPFTTIKKEEYRPGPFTRRENVELVDKIVRHPSVAHAVLKQPEDAVDILQELVGRANLRSSSTHASMPSLRHYSPKLVDQVVRHPSVAHAVLKHPESAVDILQKLQVKAKSRTRSRSRSRTRSRTSGSFVSAKSSPAKSSAKSPAKKGIFGIGYFGL
jgi:hypothetical protein